MLITRVAMSVDTHTRYNFDSTFDLISICHDVDVVSMSVARGMLFAHRQRISLRALASTAIIVRCRPRFDSLSLFYLFVDLSTSNIRTNRAVVASNEREQIDADLRAHFRHRVSVLNDRLLFDFVIITIFLILTCSDMRGVGSVMMVNCDKE